MRRMDRISLNIDKYGDIREWTRKNDGLLISADWITVARLGWNETTFKDGLSLFGDFEKIVVPNQGWWGGRRPQI